VNAKDALVWKYYNILCHFLPFMLLVRSGYKKTTEILVKQEIMVDAVKKSIANYYEQTEKRSTMGS